MPDSSVKVVNCLGIREATVPLPDVPVLVTGENASGKTSLATAIAALLAQAPNPLGLAGTGRSAYLHDDSDYGTVVLLGPGAVEWSRWVIGESSMRVFSECPPKTSASVVGLQDFVRTLKPAQRTELWEEIFLPDPSELDAELKEKLEQTVPDPKQRGGVMKTLRIKGWINAEKNYKELAGDARKRWEAIAGIRWGVRIAATWRPDGWLSRHEGMTALQCEAELEKARSDLKALQIDEAVSATDLEMGRRAKEQLPEAIRERDKARDLHRVANQKANDLNAEVAEIVASGEKLRDEHDEHLKGEPKRDAGVPCPYEECGRLIVVMQDGTLRKAEDESAYEENRSLWETKRDRLGETLERMRQLSRETKAKRDTARSEVARLEGRLHSGIARVRQLESDAEYADKEVAPDDLAPRIAVAEEQVDMRRKDSEIVGDYGKASAERDSKLGYDAVAAALGPKGVRSRAISDRMEDLHRTLKEMTDLTGWPLIELDKSYAVHIEGRPAILSSESEQWRTRYCLQSAIAIMTEEDTVLMDRADCLNDRVFPELVKLADWLHGTHRVRSVIFATNMHHVEVPDHWSVFEVASQS